MDNKNKNKINNNINENSNESNSNIKTENGLTVIQNYLEQCVWPGMGLFGESYILFSIGILRPIWNILYPNCFVPSNNNNNNDSNDTCTPTIIHSISYSVIIGVIIGMITIGCLGDRIGRRNGSILTASFMSISSIGLVCLTIFAGDSSNPSGLFLGLSLLLFIFGIGVGGEYPLSAASASEKAMEEALAVPVDVSGDTYIDINDTSPGRLRRGRRVILVFAMQGMGILFNSLSLSILLFAFHQTGAYNGDDAVYDATSSSQAIYGGYSPTSLLLIWRIVYSIGAAILFTVWISRICYLKESIVWKQDVGHRANAVQEQPTSETNSNNTMCYLQKEDDEDEVDSNQYVLYSDPTLSTLTEDNIDYSILHTATIHEHQQHTQQHPHTLFSFSYKNKLLLATYGMRLFGTCSTWLLWDIAFYGNKLFQSSFLLILLQRDNNKITLTTISLAITCNSIIALLGYFVAASIIDHVKVGRLRLQFYGFLLTGTFFLLCGYYIHRDLSNRFMLLIIYFGCSFFGQCGPNVTTFLIPAEIFPTEKRSMCHGLSAASGKLGALIAAILFNYLSNSNLFLLSGYCCFISSIITILTIPETNTLDLSELDRKWRWIVDPTNYNTNRKRYCYSGPANDDDFLSFYEQMRKLYYKRYSR